MRGITTEYRESYCWIQGTIKTKKDNFDDLIAQKITGKLPETDNNDKPKYDINLADCLPEKTPKPRHFAPVPMQQTDNTQGNNQNQQNQNQQTQQKEKSFGRRALISKRKTPKASRASSKLSARSEGRSGDSSRSNFCNYGNGNTKRLNPKFNLTSYNMGADPGVNPNTLIRSESRAYAWSKYGRPLDSKVRVYRPGFFESPNQAPEEIRDELEGPFWVSWPRNLPVPDEYAELRPIIALQP